MENICLSSAEVLTKKMWREEKRVGEKRNDGEECRGVQWVG